MSWKIQLDPLAARDFDKLERVVQARIAKFMYERLAQLDDPRSIGEALKGPRLGAHWKYRVGDYRLIASIADQVIQIVILRIGNRREVYK